MLKHIFQSTNILKTQEIICVPSFGLVTLQREDYEWVCHQTILYSIFDTKGVWFVCSKTSCIKAKLRVMNEHIGNFVEEFARLYDYAEQLKTTNLDLLYLLGHPKIQF